MTIKQHDYQFNGQILLELAANCSVVITEAPLGSASVSLDGTEDDVNRVSTQLNGQTLKVKAISDFSPLESGGKFYINGRPVDSSTYARILKEHEHLQVSIALPAESSLDARIMGIGTFTSELPFVTATLMCSGGNVYVVGNDLNISTARQPTIEATILGGELKIDNSRGQVFVRGNAANVAVSTGGAVQTNGLVSGNYIACVCGGTIKHRGGVTGQVLKSGDSTAICIL